MAGSNRGLWIAMCVPAALVGSVMYFKWNADGPGTHGGGEDLHVTLEAPMAAPMQPPESALTQRRHERASISGTVRDSDARPIAGAHVCAAASSSLLGSETRWPRCTRSDRDGHYRLEDLHGVRQRVSAGAVGHLPADHLHLLAGVLRRAVDLRPGGAAEDIDITLAPGGVEIRGTIRDLHGAAIADASVTSGGADQGNGVVSVTTDADGAYALWVRPGETTVTAQAPGRVTARTTGPSDANSFDLYLAPASSLRGRAVRADNGDPVDGAWVRALPGGAAVKTDPAGHFVFDDLPPGIYTPRAVTDDGAGALASPITLGLGETSPLLEIVMGPAAFVEGRLTYQNGEVCDDGTLTLHDPTRDTTVSDTTEPGGMVHIRGLLPGSYEVRVACKGALPARSYPRVIVRDRDILEQSWRVERGHSVAGALLDADGRPVAGATLAVTADPARLTAVSDDAGRFVLRGLAPGRHFVAAVADPQHTMPAAPVPVDIVDADITTLRLVLAATGEVRGHLRDPQRRAIAGATLSLRSSGGELHTRTGADGGFLLAAAALGPTVVSAHLGDAPLPLRAPTTLVVRGDRSTTLALVATPPTGAITVQLLDPAGQPVAGALIEARPELPGADAGRTGLWREGGEPPLLTDAAGRVTLTALIAAPYTVVARRFGGGEARQTHVRPGAPLTLALPY